jgi:tetratricopeptide (TPR) repeat protein
MLLYTNLRCTGFFARFAIASERTWFGVTLASNTSPGIGVDPPSTAPLGRIAIRAAILWLLLCLTRATLAQEYLPPSSEAKIAAGVAALKSGDLDGADKIFSEALQHGVKHPLVYHNLGIIAQQRGQPLKAVTRFRQALVLEPGFGPAHLLLGSSLLELKRNAEALGELERAVKLMPQEPQAYLQLAKAYEASENWIAAVEQLQKLVELAPQEPEYAYQLGRAWMKLSGWSYQQISKLDPHSARLQQALGQEYAVQEKYDLALSAFQKAAEYDPKLPEIHLAVALLCLQLKRFDDALAAINVELGLVPESKAALDAKARIEAARAAAPSPGPP